MRFSFSILLLVVFSVCSFGQKNKRPNYNLLWRISGNGLPRPSYLFGTMHLQDNRAFDFNDSLLTKLIQCDAFAMEIHPDSITRYVASVLLDESDEETIENRMSPDEFRHYDSLMRKNTGLSLRKFKTVKNAKYFMEQRLSKKDKNTFLDAWLYNIAREHGKAMVGLEDFRAQLALTEEDDSTELDEFKSYLSSGEARTNESFKSLFEFYYEGDIEKIFGFMHTGGSEEYFKKLIVDRNKVMTDNIVREIQQHSMFIAVGAGHLGGEPGIVNALREKGYVLTPVRAPFSGTASKYKHVNATAEKWIVFTSDEGGYSVEMPQTPVPVKMKQMPITFQTYVDIGNLSVYMAAHLPVVGAVNSQLSSKMLDEMVKRMGNTQKITGVKKVMVGDSEGREFETYKDDIFFKVRLMISNSNLYMLMVGPSKENANSPEGKRFLLSLKTKAPVNVTTASFVEKKGAFALDMPGQVTTQVVTPRDPVTGKIFKINIFVTSDNGSMHLVRYNDFPAGYVSPNDSAYIHSTLHAMYDAMNGTDLSTDSIGFHGYPSTHFTFSSGNSLVKTEGVVTIRGERFYLLMNSRAAGDDDAKFKAFFNSFRFLPYEKPSLKKMSFADGFSLLVPETFEADSAILGKPDARHYAFADRFSGTMFTIQKESFSKYREEENAEAFFESMRERYEESKGTVMSDSGHQGKLPVHEYQLQSPKRNALTRIRCVVTGKSLISLWGYFEPDAPELVDKVFSSFNVTPTSDWDLFADKSDLILNDLGSPDSTTRAEAKAALMIYDFKDRHLPKIYEALKKQYDDDSEEWGGTRSSLLNVLARIHDDKTQTFIDELYPTLPDSTRLRDHALNVLSSIKTTQSVKRMAEIIAADSSGHHFASYHVMDPLEDSLSLLNDVSLSLLKSFSKFEESSTLLRVISMALDSNVFAAERRQEIVIRLTAIATEIADAHLPEDADGYYELVGRKYNVAKALKSIPFTAQVSEIVNKLATENDDDVKLQCLQILLMNKVNIPQTDIDLLASKRSMRLQLYEELLNYNMQERMGKKYITPQMLAESEMYEYLSDDESPDKINFVKEKKVIVNGEKKRLFVFTYGWEGSKDAYIAIAGPYSLNSTAFTRGDLTTSLWVNYESDKQMTAKLAEYLLEKNMKLAD